MYSYFLIRLAPDPVRGEFLNIGVALYSADGEFADVRCNPDLTRGRRLSPGFSEDDLSGLEAGLRADLRSGRRDPLLTYAADAFSHALRFTAPTGVLATDPAAELDDLYRRYAAPVEGPARERGERERILRHLRDVFETGRILPHLRERVALRELLPEAGADTFRFDFYYSSGATHSALQAVALDDDEARVKSLCFTARELRERLRNGSRLQWTAVIDDEPAEAAENWRYRHSWLGREQLRIRSWREAPRIAAEIQAELHVA